jgi:ABC-type branched-subunit amino acid transport system substrate-binding protein/TolA-binding protein
MMVVMLNKMTHYRLLLLISVTVVMILHAGCGVGQRIYPKKRIPSTYPPATSQPEPARPSPALERDLLRDAETAQLEGRDTEALAKYEEFLTAFPNSSRRAMALAATGQLREKLGQKKQAIAAYQDLVANHPRSPFSDEASRRLANLYLETGMYDRAAPLLGDMISQSTLPEEKARLQNLLARGYLGQGHPIGALELFRLAYQGTPDPVDKDEALRGMKASVQAMNPTQLLETQRLLGKEYPGPYASYVLAYRLFELGKTEEADTQLLFFIETFPDDDLLTDAEALRKAIQNEGAPPTLARVTDFDLAPPVEGPLTTEMKGPEGPLPPYQSMDLACLLALSESRGAKFGQLIHVGLKLALDLYQPQTPGFKTNLTTYDTKGEPETANAQLREAASRSEILAVVGPFLKAVAETAAPQAEALGLPMIALTQKADVQDAGSHIFRLFLTPKDQAQAVARYTVQILGFNRLAILYPDENYGRIMRDYFQEEVQALGGTVVSQSAYDTKTTDFSEQIRELAGVGKAVRKSGIGRQVEVGFDAVFIPDGYRAVTMIAPQFAYHDITDIRLLGTTLWQNPQLLNTAARYIQRAIIPTPFYPQSEKPDVQRFVKAYQEFKGDANAVPNEFVAYGFDAGTLLLTLMDRHHVSTRDELVRALHSFGTYNGVTGRFSFGSQGEYRSEPILLIVEGNEFKPIQ